MRKRILPEIFGFEGGKSLANELFVHSFKLVEKRGEEYLPISMIRSDENAYRNWRKLLLRRCKSASIEIENAGCGLRIGDIKPETHGYMKIPPPIVT